MSNKKKKIDSFKKAEEPIIQEELKYIDNPSLLKNDIEEETEVLETSESLEELNNSVFTNNEDSENIIEEKEEILEEPVVLESVFTKDIKEESTVHEDENTEPVFIKEKKEQIYQITYFENNEKEVVFYTMSCPEFNKETEVFKFRIYNCFKKFTLSENVLNKKIIKVSYKGEQEIPSVDIDLRMGVVIKLVNVENWMKVEKVRAETKFHTRVLECYREFTKNLKVTPTTISDNDTTTEFEPLY